MKLWEHPRLTGALCAAAVLACAVMPAAFLAVTDAAYIGRVVPVADPYTAPTPAADDYYILRQLAARRQDSAELPRAEEPAAPGTPKMYIGASASLESMSYADAATADAAGVNVTAYKYLATLVGGMLAGLGGLYFVMEYTGGTWVNNGFGDRGWLAIALVIFARWRPLNAIWGSILFGGLYILYLYIPGLDRSMQEIFKALPYVVTIVVLVITSLRKKREDQPPMSLGVAYFREDRG